MARWNAVTPLSRTTKLYIILSANCIRLRFNKNRWDSGFIRAAALTRFMGQNLQRKDVNFWIQSVFFWHILSKWIQLDIKQPDIKQSRLPWQLMATDASHLWDTGHWLNAHLYPLLPADRAFTNLPSNVATRTSPSTPIQTSYGWLRNKETSVLGNLPSYYPVSASWNKKLRLCSDAKERE